jgi:hypothetical protein
MKNRRCFCIFFKALFIGASLFSQIQNGKYVFQNETIVIGYSAHLIKGVDLADAKVVTSVLIQQMLDRWAVQLTSEVVIYDDLSVLKQDIREKRMDIIALTTPEYFLLRKQVQFTPFLTYKNVDRILDRMLLVSRKDSRNRSIHDLKGKKIAVFSNLDDELNMPNLWFTTLVLKSAENYPKDYASTVYRVQKGTNAISDVFFKNADAAVIPELDFIISNELNPQIGAQLSVVDSSGKMLYSVLCYTDKMTGILNRYKDRNVKSVVDMLCSTDTTDAGKHFLSIFRITGFVPFEGGYLNDTETLFKDFSILSANHHRSLKDLK